MKLSNEIKVTSALLHQAINLPALAEKTLNSTKAPGIEMVYTPQGLVIRYRGVNALVPSANIAMMLFETEAPFVNKDAKNNK